MMHGPSLPLALGHRLCMLSAGRRSPAQDAAHGEKLARAGPKISPQSHRELVALSSPS